MRRSLLFVLLALLPLGLIAAAEVPPALDIPTTEAPTAAPQSLDAERVKRGNAVYDRYCISCHGVEGDGRGYSAPWLDPAPRDFTRGVFKWRSTPSGSLPTNEDLMRTLTVGLFHTNMPSWGVLGERNLRDVVEYLKTFSPAWKEQAPAAPIQIPAEPTNDAVSREKGGEVWTRLACASCHGATGKGDGPSGSTLVDDWGHKILPHDFTRGHYLKCGDRSEDLYRVFMTGMSGTPMPSYAESLSPAEAWSLVHYVQSLVHEEP